MTDEIKYGKPPIVEVVCEFRFVPGQPWDAAIPGLVYSRVSQTFPKRKTLRNLQSELIPAEGGIRQHVELTERAQFLRDDEKAFLQIGPDFLAVNHLAPYPTWDKFVPLISEAYDGYRTVTKPSGLKRIGLRYINRIVFPGDSLEFSDYLKFYPFTGPELPQNIHNFVVGVQSSYEQKDVLRVQLSSADPDESGRVTMLLDLDYFLARPESVGLEQGLDWVNRAHDRVLSVFEACLTERTRQMFDPLKG